MNLYAYQLTLNPQYQDFSSWNQIVNDTLQAHANYLRQGLSEGKVVFVGRTDAGPKENFGLAIFKAAGAVEAEVFMKGDPVVQAGIMSAKVFPFKLLMVTDDAKQWNIW